MAKAAGNHAKRAEVEKALLGLGDADLLRLRRFAQLRSRPIPSIEWQDLLQEATARALDGRRKWPLTVDFMAFMRQTIRSIANEYIRREDRKPAHAEFDDEQIVDRSLNSEGEPERRVLAENLLAEIHALFANDPQVLAIFSGLAADESPHEIQDRSGMSPTEYASAQKRIRRGLARNIPEAGVRS